MDLAQRIARLSPDRQKLLELRLSQGKRGKKQKRSGPVEPAEEKEYYALSASQERMYILNLFVQYTLPLGFHTVGELDRGRFEKAFQTLVQRHESLRTSFENIGGETVQRIHGAAAFEIEYYDAGQEDEKKRTGKEILNQPELTNEKFLRGVQGGSFFKKRPPGRRRQKLYRSGDLARWLLDGIERKLVEIWSEALGMEKEEIGIDDNFFRLGGHSLKATAVVSGINRELDVRVPLIELFRTPTIRQLSEYARGEEGKILPIKDEQLVLLKRGNEKAGPFFFIHDGSGEVEGYIEFCRRLKGEFTCWSIGGTIAFEMVRQLEEQGEKKVFLALMDTVPPGKSLQAGVIETSSSEFQKAAADYFTRTVPNADHMSKTDFISYLNMVRTFDNARDKYIPGGKIHTAVHFLKADEQETFDARKWDMYCTMYCTRPLKIYHIPGDHFSIFKMPNVKEFAHLFDRVANKVHV